MPKKEGVTGPRNGRPLKSLTNNQGQRNDIPTKNPKKVVTREQPRVNYAEEDVGDDEGIQLNANTADAVALDMNRCTRLMIACMYEKDYHPDRNIIEVIKDIRARCRLTRHYDVGRVIEDYNRHKALGIQYTGNRVFESKAGRKAILDVGSVESQLVADAIEQGTSLQLAHLIVNTHRQQQELPSVTYSAVCPS